MPPDQSDFVAINNSEEVARLERLRNRLASNENCAAKISNEYPPTEHDRALQIAELGRAIEEAKRR
jgi:hypothetical protein